jgi:hypothetical protein
MAVLRKDVGSAVLQIPALVISSSPRPSSKSPERTKAGGFLKDWIHLHRRRHCFDERERAHVWYSHIVPLTASSLTAPPLIAYPRDRERQTGEAAWAAWTARRVCPSTSSLLTTDNIDNTCKLPSPTRSFKISPESFSSVAACATRTPTKFLH